MIEFILLHSINFIVGYLFFWLDVKILAFIPGIISVASLLSLIGIGQFSLNNNKIKEYGALFSRGIITIGLYILLIHQGLSLYQNFIILGILHLILYTGSYYSSYKNGKYISLYGLLLITILTLSYMIYGKLYQDIPIIIIILGLSIFINSNIILSYIGSLTPEDVTQLYFHREIGLYTTLGFLLYHLFLGNNFFILLSGIVFISTIIVIKQYLKKQEPEIQKITSSSINGRSLLAGKTVLHHTQYVQNSGKFIRYIIEQSYIPSNRGILILEYSNIILVILLIIHTIKSIIQQQHNTLIRYRIGIIIFIATVFGTQEKGGFTSLYRKTALGVMTLSYYITLFDTLSNTVNFVWGSLLWICINMIFALFYKELRPNGKNILTKNDILLRLIMIIIGGLITTISLIWLPINGSILFALGCIIIGIIGYFSYHIWEKYIYNK